MVDSKVMDELRSECEFMIGREKSKKHQQESQKSTSTWGWAAHVSNGLFFGGFPKGFPEFPN